MYVGSQMKPKILMAIALCTALSAQAQQILETTDITVRDLGDHLLKITVEVKNISNKSISEIAGFLDIYDKTGSITEKKDLAVVLKSDVPLKPEKNAARSVIITQRPNMSGTVRFRVTNLRFFGEPEIYLICPNCGELILKE